MIKFVSQKKKKKNYDKTHNLYNKEKYLFIVLPEYSIIFL